MFASGRSRRYFLLGGLALTSTGVLAGCGVIPLGVQQSPPIRRIGFLIADLGRRDDRYEAFRARLRDLGWTEGQNLAIEWRSAETRAERLPDLASELVQLDVGLIVAANTRVALAVRQVSATLPVVLAGGDILGSGLVTNIARPEGFVTGVTNATVELCAKRLELLKEAIPPLSRVAVVSDPATPISAPALRETTGAGIRLGVRVQPLTVGDLGQLDDVFRTILAERAEAVVVFPSPILHNSGPTRERFIAFATQQKLPTIWEADDAAAAGGLISYGPDSTEMYRQSAVYVDKLLRGAQPPDLPIERPNRYYLNVNLKVAQAFGLTLAPAVLQQATEIIQ